MTRAPTGETLDRFKSIVGERGFIAEEEAKAPYLREWRGTWFGKTPLVLRPANSDEVSRILALASETETAIVPQSGNTGLVGGQIPSPHGDEIVLSLERMTRIIKVDVAESAITVEAGATLKSVQDAAAEVGMRFPLSLASEGTSRIGGNLASNAGGVHVLAYGHARDLCLGLEVVLADGRVWHGLKTLRKDNSGYDLRNIFIGSEGTLGVITAATLKLFPAVRRHDTTLAAVPKPEAALQLLTLARRLTGNRVEACELLPDFGIELTVKHSATRRALDTVSPWYVLLELADATGDLLYAVLEEAQAQGLVTDAVVAQTETQRRELWALRENMSDSQRHEGASIKHDVALPLGAIARFIAEASEVIQRVSPGCRLCCFGHLGDGNLHFNVSQPVDVDRAAFLSLAESMNAAVHEIVIRLGGSISAEHGIGVHKREVMARIKSSVELEMMRGLKRMLDPKGILNPGKVLP